MATRISIILAAPLASGLVGCAPQSDLHPIPLVAPQQTVVVRQVPPPPVGRVVRRKPVPVVVRPAAVPIREPMPVIIREPGAGGESGWGG